MPPPPSGPRRQLSSPRYAVPAQRRRSRTPHPPNHRPPTSLVWSDPMPRRANSTPTATAALSESAAGAVQTRGGGRNRAEISGSEQRKTAPDGRKSREGFGRGEHPARDPPPIRRSARTRGAGTDWSECGRESADRGGLGIRRGRSVRVAVVGDF